VEFEAAETLAWIGILLGGLGVDAWVHAGQRESAEVLILASLDLSHRERGSMRRSSFQGTSSQNAERERAGTEHGTQLEHDPAGRSPHQWKSTALPRELDHDAARSRSSRRGNWTASLRQEREAKRRVPIGARRGR
jgi:hypothetical protein